VLVAASAVLERGEQNPLVQVRHGARRGQRTEEPEDPGAAADLGGARGAALDVAGQARGVSRFELVEQERADQVASTRAVQGTVALRVRHIPYMT
jgi:hypothetical protein